MLRSLRMGLLALALWCPAALAQAVRVPPEPPRPEPPEALTNPYRIESVLVDRTAASAAQARELAIRDGQRFAWRRLVERLAPPDLHVALMDLPAAQIADLFDYFEVQRERYSTTRYLAALTIVFKPDLVRAQVNRDDLPTAAEIVRREQAQRAAAEEPEPDHGPVSRLTARVAVASMAELIQIRRQLAATQPLRRADQVSLTRTEAVFELHYVGEEPALIEALRQNALALARAPDGWQLGLAPPGATPAAAPAPVTAPVPLVRGRP